MSGANGDDGGRGPRAFVWQALARRDFLRLGLGAGAAALLPQCKRDAPTPPASAVGARPALAAFTGVGGAGVPPDEPVASGPEGRAPAQFFGDELERFHAVLWDKPKAMRELGGMPARPTQRARVCIVGGGLSGLSCAWLLRDLRPVVLEGATRLGGNAKGMLWGDLAYGLGSAYITGEDRTAGHMRMLSAIGLTGSWRLDEPIHDKMVVDGTLYPRFWYGGTDPDRADDFVAAWKYFERVREEAYPDVPFEEGRDLTRAAYEALDRISFQDELRRSLGARLHPHVEDMVRQYCWSSFGADSTEISAAAGLNFLASDLGGMYVFPGGNSAISQALTRAIRAECGTDSLRARSLVLDVRRAEDGVHVTYADPDGRLTTLACDVCVISTPKFVVKRLVDDLPAERVTAIEALTYRAYVVGHVLIDQPRTADFHDQYCIAGQAPQGTLAQELDRRPFTDVILASFATEGHPSRTVLNLYRGIPYDGGRAELILPEAYERTRKRFEGALPAILRTLNLDPTKVVDLRLSRWGHPLVVPKVGMLTSGLLERASAPLADRILFAQQDNYAMSAFEPAYAAARRAAESARKLLGA